MISVYEGVLGGGKSYHAVKHVLAYLAGGGRIYTNIELVREECEKIVLKRYGVILNWEEQVNQLNPEDIAKLHLVARGGSAESPTLCVIDELHLYHNARDWAKSDRDMLAWLTQSRKLFVDIIFIVQHRNNVDKQWLRLTAGFWRGRDLRKWKIPGLGVGWPFKQFLWCCYDQDGKTLVRRDFEFIDGEIFKCYRSDQLFAGTGPNAGAGLGKVKLEKVKGGNMRIIIMVGTVVVAVVSVVLGRSAFARLNPEPVVKQIPASNVVREIKAVEPPMPRYVEIEPGLTAWSPDGKFLWAQVNGHRTERPPVLNKRGEWVYVVELADLSPEEYERQMRLIEHKREMELAPLLRTNGVERNPDKNPKRPQLPRKPGGTSLI